MDIREHNRTGGFLRTLQIIRVLLPVKERRASIETNDPDPLYRQLGGSMVNTDYQAWHRALAACTTQQVPALLKVLPHCLTTDDQETDPSSNWRRWNPKPRPHPGVAGHLKPTGNPVLDAWQETYVRYMRRQLGPDAIVEETPTEVQATPQEHARFERYVVLTLRVVMRSLTDSAPEQRATLIERSLRTIDFLGYLDHVFNDNVWFAPMHELSLRHHYIPEELSKMDPALFLRHFVQWFTPLVGALAVMPSTRLPAVNAAKLGVVTLLWATPLSLITHAWAHRNRRGLPPLVQWLQRPERLAEVLRQQGEHELADVVAELPSLSLDPQEHARHHRDHSIAYSGLTGQCHALMDGDPKAGEGEIIRMAELVAYKLFGFVPVGWREDPKVMQRAFAYEQRLKQHRLYRALAPILERRKPPEEDLIRGVLRAVENRDALAPEGIG